MKGSRVAKRYARALLDLADKGVEEKWGVELERLAAMVESPELLERLASPELAEQSRQEAMAKIAERLDLSIPLRSFAVVVARHGRIRELGAIAEAYGDLLDRAMGRERATLTFAIQPSDAEVARSGGRTRKDRGAENYSNCENRPRASRRRERGIGRKNLRRQPCNSPRGGKAPACRLAGNKRHHYGGNQTIGNQRNPQKRNQGF